MGRVWLWTSTIASVLSWGFALLMALLEVVHLAHGQSEHVAGTFAMHAVAVAAVFTVAARIAARPGGGAAAAEEQVSPGGQ